jgi:hypothetical protein
MLKKLLVSALVFVIGIRNGWGNLWWKIEHIYARMVECIR